MSTPTTKKELLKIFRTTLTRINNLDLKKTDVNIEYKKKIKGQDEIYITIFKITENPSGQTNCSLRIWLFYKHEDIINAINIFLKLLKKEDFKTIKKYCTSILLDEENWKTAEKLCKT